MMWKDGGTEAVRILRVVLLSILLSPSAAWAVLPVEGETVFLGVGECANPLCHGGGQGGRVRLDEYLVWHQRDRHAGAYRSLLEPRGQQIAKNLGIAAPEKDARCLDCHAANIAEERRGERFQLSDGVTCEVCHGGAKGWIESHKVVGTPRQQNLDRGMYPTDDVVARGELCLSCHLGTAKQFVTHRIMAAGHPRVSFELDTFTQIQPPHFDVDADYRNRGKQAPEAVKTWAIGEMLAAREYLGLLELRVGNTQWPEFALFDCYSCHQRIRDPLRSKDVVVKVDLALPRLRSHSLLASLDVLRMANPDLAKRYEAALSLVSSEAERGRYGPAKSGQGGQDPRRLLGEGIAAVGAWSPDLEQVRRLAQAMTGRYARQTPLSYFHADQGFMAVQAMTATLFTISPDPRAKTALDRLFATTGSDAEFDPDRFRKEMSALGAALSRAP
jgi:hypothetical protein